MKTLTIYQEGVVPIVINDEDDEGQDLESYTKEASLIFEHSNVSILKTKFKSVISRPSKIVSIIVEDFVDDRVKESAILRTNNKGAIQSKKPSKEKKESKKDEYVLTDE